MRAPPLPLAFALAALLAGCGNEHRERASPSATVPGPILPLANSGVPVGIPGGAAKVIALVNPEGKAPYSGPMGTLRGTVRIDGDPPPETGLTFPDRCRDSSAVYGKLFRIGLDKALADAIVGVTGYDGFVPASSEAYRVTLRNCVPSRRTYVLTFGQRMEVENLDEKDSYSPFLDGLPMRSIMVALPKGSPVKIYPTISTKGQVTHYMLRDQLQSGLVADVLVVNYATHDVTGLDGKYEIKGIPVGKVRVDTSLWILGKSEGKEVEIKEGDNTLDFTLHYDASKDDPTVKRAAAAAAASAAAAAAKAAAPPGTADAKRPPKLP
jgi:hypothetical protein